MRKHQSSFRAGETTALFYPVGMQAGDPDPVIAEVVPEYAGNVSAELQAELDGMISKKESDREDD
jgi:hypothetical protein